MKIVTPKASPEKQEGGSFTEDVKAFSAHCAYIRSVYTLATTVWKDVGQDEFELMEKVSPAFFQDMGQVLAEYVVLAACRITDPAKDGAKNENFTVEFFVNSFPPNSRTFTELEALRVKMNLTQ